MTLRNLQIFVAVAECCNMTKAAEKLYVSQPSVSMAISDIEREYDITLFDRTAGKLILTQTGQHLLHYAKLILNTEKEMEHFLHNESSNYCVSIGVTITIGSSIISPIIDEMRVEMPNVDYHVTVANTSIIENMLMEGNIDIGLVEGEIKNPNLEIRPVINDQLVLICSTKHPFSARDSIRITELSKVPLILREPNCGTRDHFEKVMHANNIDMTVRWSSYSYGAIVDAVRHNLGVGIISEKLAMKYAASGDLHICSITDSDLSRSFKLVYRKNKYITDVVLRFSEICGNSNYFDIDIRK